MPKWKKLKSQKKKLKMEVKQTWSFLWFEGLFFNYHIFLNFFREGGGWVEEGFLISGEVFFVLK